MAFSQDDKLELTQKLMVTRQEAGNLEMELRFSGKHAEADQARQRARDLQTQIDRLLGAVIDEWTEAASVNASEIDQANADVETTIAAVRQRTETAQDITRAIGLIDDVVAMAARIAI